MADSTPSSPVLFNAQLWSGNNTHTPASDAKPAQSPPPASPLSRRSVSFQVDHSPFISVDPSAAVYDAFPGTSAISPASTASPLPDPAYSPLSAPLHTLSEADPSTPSSAAAQVFDAFSWSAAITPHDYASAPQPYTPGHPANVAHREAMERELSYEGADPEVVEGNSAPSRRSSSSSRRRGSGSDSAATSQNAAGTSTAHARAVAAASKPKSHARKMSAGHILRPRNAFIIFRSAMIKDGAITESMEKDHGNISTICGILWRKLSPSEKLKYQRLADLEKEQHRIANPGYKYAPKTRKEPPARRRQKKDQDVVARRCALAAALLAEGRRGSEMKRQLEHFDTEVATQIKQEKEEAARLGIRPDPYAHAHSAKKLKRMEKERKERERALAAQAGAANLREGVLAMHAQADAQAAEKARAAAAGPFSRAPRNGYAVPPAPAAPAPTAPSAPAWINPWAASSVPEGANMGRRPSSCPPPAAGNISIPALPTVPSVPVYNDYVSPTQPHTPHLVIDNMQQSHPGPATAPLHHPQPQSNSGFAVPRRRSSSVPPPSLYAAPAQQSYPSRWEGARRPSVVFSMDLERRPSQVQWNDDMGMGDARRPSLAGLSFGAGAGWSRRPSAMMWAPQERRMSAQAPNGSWYSNGMNSASHLDEPAEPQINFGNFSFQTTTNANGSYAPNAGGLAAPGVGPDQAYQFPPAAPNDVEMYNDLGPSPFGAILAQQNQGMPAVAHGGWHGHQNEARSTMSPAPAGYSHAPHTPEADFYQPPPAGNHFAVPSVQVHEPTWSAPLSGDHSVPHTPSGSSPHTGIDEEEGDMFQPFGEEVAFPELNHGSREGSRAPEPRVGAFPPHQAKSLPYPHSSVPLSDIIHDTAIGPEDDMNAYTQGADNIGLGYDNWKMLGQVNERFD